MNNYFRKAVVFLINMTTVLCVRLRVVMINVTTIPSMADWIID